MMNEISGKIKGLEGKWVALDRQSNEVVEHAESLRELNEKVRQLSRKVVFFKVPKLDVHFVPSAR